MPKCKSCRKEYKADDYMGYDVKGDGIIMMGCQSKYDFNIYQFTLVEGWYCVYCLDREIQQGLCQPIFDWTKTKSKIHPFEVFVPFGDEERNKRTWQWFMDRCGLEQDKDGTFRKKK